MNTGYSGALFDINKEKEHKCGIEYDHLLQIKEMTNHKFTKHRTNQ